ncbi:universal stress protein [Aureibaculum conchae]|uniref:universal stress protein n=1 Tax=Aureibaculum sp. 2308TA14-22 TaxID=3108392 RepID=UPI0033913DCC
MKNILIPTDFSDNAWDALLYAIRLYDNVPSRFYILNTFQIGTSRTTNRMSSKRGTKLFRVLQEESEKGLQKIQNYLNENLLNDNHEYKTLSKTGDLYINLKQIVSQNNIDIIIMGTTGATGAKEIFMGSNAVKVINNIDLCPVLTVPKNYDFNELKNIAFATDLKKKFSALELSSLIELQTIYQCEISILHVKEYDNLDENQLIELAHIKSLFHNESLTHYKEIGLNGNVAKTIIEFSEKHNVDLVCLVNHEKKFLQKLMQEAVVKKVNFRSEIPILTIPM